MASTPKVTADMLKKALAPANNCQVAQFLTTIKDSETRNTIIAAIDMPRSAMPSQRLATLLKEWGFDTALSADQITAHRSRRKPCRCDA